MLKSELDIHRIFKLIRSKRYRNWLLKICQYDSVCIGCAVSNLTAFFNNHSSMKAQDAAQMIALSFRLPVDCFR